MKILVTSVQVPFIRGGAELHAKNLTNALIERGHEAEIVTIPFNDSPLHVISDHIVASRMFSIDHMWAGKMDLCIGLKFPSYFMPHSNKVIWALHQHRAAYDLFDTEFSNIKNNSEGNRIKRIITQADKTYLAEAKRVYANSRNVSNRMQKYNGITSTPLYHPCPDMDQFYCDSYEDYILMPSRINITKRQKLAVEAMKYTKSNLKLYIVGGADNKIVENDLLDTIKAHKVEHKVRYLGHISQEEKFNLYANARAVMFIPLDEDYGYITLEAMAASKPVITATDSGGPLEFIDHDLSGYVSEANPREIAKRVDMLADQSLAETMGAKAKQKLTTMNISWDNVVKELTK